MTRIAETKRKNFCKSRNQLKTLVIIKKSLKYNYIGEC